MNMNECVKRLAILYMVKSGRIAKSAQGRIKLPPQVESMLSKLWKGFSGETRYVRPGMAKIQGAIEQATPQLRHGITQEYRKRLREMVDKMLTQENVPPEVKESVIAAAEKGFDKVRFGHSGSIDDAVKAGLQSAQKAYVRSVGKSDIDLAKLRFIRPDEDMIISQHYGPLRDILRGLGDLDKDPNVFSDMKRHLAAVGRGSLHDKRELPEVIRKRLAANRPIRDVATTAAERAVEGIGAYEIGRRIIGAGSSNEQPSSPQGAPAQPQNVGARQAAPASELFDYGARLLDAK